MTYTIEKGVPITRVTNEPARKYPLREMEVGDSFFVDAPGDEYKELRGRVSSAISQEGRRRGARFATRKAEGGFRVWRVE